MSNSKQKPDVITYRDLINISVNMNEERVLFLRALIKIARLKDEPRAVEIAKKAIKQSAEEFGTA